MNKGFTLVEVLATISILAIVIVITFPVFTGTDQKIKEATYNSKIAALESAMLKYGNTYLLDYVKPETCKTNCYKDFDLYDFVVAEGIYGTETETEDGKAIIVNPKTNEKLTGKIRLTFNLETGTLESKFIE